MGRHKGAHTVVNTHKGILSPVGHKRQSVAHRMKTRFPARSNPDRGVETVGSAELLPIGMLLGRQHQDDADVGQRTHERIDGAHQHRPAVDGKELLGHLSAHPQSLAACHHDDITVHHDSSWV